MWSGVLHDKVVKCLTSSESEECVSNSELDNDNELDDSALLCVVVDGNSHEDDDIQDSVWVDMNTYKGWTENFMGSVRP